MIDVATNVEQKGISLECSPLGHGRHVRGAVEWSIGPVLPVECLFAYQGEVAKYRRCWNVFYEYLGLSPKVRWARLPGSRRGHL